MTPAHVVKSPEGMLGDANLTWKEHGSTTATITPHVTADQVLRQSPIPALRKLRVEETKAEIVIVGSVASYYLKQLAQESLMPVLAGRELLNRVNVVRS